MLMNFRIVIHVPGAATAVQKFARSKEQAMMILELHLKGLPTGTTWQVLEMVETVVQSGEIV